MEENIFDTESGSVIEISQEYDGNANGNNPDITLAQDCTLLFKAGGKLSNCSVQGTGIILQFENPLQWVFNNVTFSGTFICPCFHPEQFGAVGNGTTDDTTALQQCIHAATASKVYHVVLLPKTYLITDTLYYRGNLCLEGQNYSDFDHQQGSVILANLQEGGENNVPVTLKYALDSDCYQGVAIKRLINDKLTVVAVEHTENRFPAGVRLGSGSILYFSQEGNTDAIHLYDHQPNAGDVKSDPLLYNSNYAAPLYIKNVAFESTNNSFGAIRCIGMTHALIEGISIRGFMSGMALSKGWAFKVERVQMKVALWGILLGGEITAGYFDTVQMLCNRADVSGNKYNNYKSIMDGFVKSSTCYRTVQTNDNEDIHSAAVAAQVSSALFNSCSMENFDIGCIGYNMKLIWNTPLIQGITRCIAHIQTGSIYFNNVNGNQGNTDGFTYSSSCVTSKIVLNNAHAGTFSSVSNNDTITYDFTNLNNYNSLVYVVENHDKENRPLPYNSTTYLDYDVGDTLYVCAPSETNQNNFGNTSTYPVPLPEALSRIASDRNYRHVKRLVLTENVSLSETHEWKALSGSIELTGSHTLTLGATQDICCDVTFSGVTLTLNTNLCRVYGKAILSLNLIDCAVTGNNHLLIYNAGTLPVEDGRCVVVKINIDSATVITGLLMYHQEANNWQGITDFTVEVNGVITSNPANNNNP